MRKLMWVLSTALLALLLGGCGAAPMRPSEAGSWKPSKAQLCRFERGNCQTIILVDERPIGGAGAP